MFSIPDSVAKNMGTVSDISDPTGDSQLFPEFYKDPLTGAELVRIRIPGDKHFEPVFPAEEYQNRFPRHWELFRAQRDQHEDETVLEECGWIDEATRIHLKSYGIFSLEALASLSDGNLQNVGMGASMLRERAIKLIDGKQKAAAFEVQESAMSAMQRQIDEMRAELAAKPKRGRPPKVAEGDAAEAA